MAQVITLGPPKVITPWQAEWRKTIDSLNTYQQGNLREVVYGKNPTQNARMIAAAGAGKTRTLIAILAEALGKGVLRPEETVTTTFTRMAGAEMRERLRAHVDPAIYQKLEWGKRVATFHSIAMSWLKRNDPTPPPHGWSKYNLDAKRGEDADEGGGKIDAPEAEDDLMVGLADFLLVIDASARWMKDKDKDKAREFGNRMQQLSRLSPGEERRGLAEELWPEMAKLASYYDKRETTRSLFMKICGDWPVPGTGHRGLNLPEKAPAPGEYGQVIDIIRSRGLRRDDPEAQDLVEEYTKDFRQLDDVWALYDEAKMGLGAFDYADALQAFYDKMHQGAKLVQVDEFQDQSLIQINIGLKLARNGGGKLVLIGDPRQAIYAFRGADIEYALHTDAPPVSAITLEIPTNYRSGRMIVETGNVVCKGAFWSVGEPAIPARRDRDAAGMLFRPEGLVDVKGYGDAEEEASAVAAYIAEKHRAGSRLGDFAILSRGRAAMAEYEVALLRERLPVIIVGVDAPFFSRKNPKNILRLLIAAAETPYGTSVPTQALVRSKRWNASSPIEALLSVYNKRGDTAGFKYMQGEAFTLALQAAFKAQPDVVKALRTVLGQTYETPKGQTKAFRNWKPGIDRLIADIERIRAGATWAEQVQIAAAAMLPPKLRAKLRGAWLTPYRTLTKEQGPAEVKIEVPAPPATPGQPPKADPAALLAEEEEIAAATEMFASTASRYEDLESLLSLAASMDDRALGESEATGGTVHAGDIGNKEGRALEEIREAMKNRVTISTIHGYKGLEAHTVFISCTGNVFPSVRGDFEEERRLAYVAFTRAENELHVTYWGAPPPPNKPYQKGGPSPFVRYVGSLLSRVEQKIPFFYDVEPMLRSAAPKGWHLASGRPALEADGPSVEWKSATGKFVTLTARYAGGATTMSWTAVSEAGVIGAPTPRFEDAVLASAKYMLGQRAQSPEGEMDMDSYIAFAFSRGDEPTGHGLTWAQFALWLTQNRAEIEPTVQRTLADLSASRGSERLLA